MFNAVHLKHGNILRTGHREHCVNSSRTSFSTAQYVACRAASSQIRSDETYATESISVSNSNGGSEGLPHSPTGGSEGLPHSPTGTSAASSLSDAATGRRFTNGSLHATSTAAISRNSSHNASTSSSQKNFTREEFSQLTTDEQLKVLADAKKRSREILQKIKQKQAALTTSSAPAQASSPRLVDIRMFEQVVASRDRMSEKLSEANQYVRVLEDKMLAQNEEFSMVLDILNKMVLEVGNVSRLSHNAAAAIRFSVDTGEPEEKCLQVSERMAVLSKVLNEQLIAVEAAIFREVPVYWHGVAESVKIMGDFDEWTQGVELNSETANDSVVTTFEAVLYLRPGRYRCKFLVDGEWKLAPDWINEWDDKTQETNNVLVVG